MPAPRQNTARPGTVYVIFPCYNEEEGLEKLLTRYQRVQKIAGRPFRFVVVSDGSWDHSVVVAKSFADEMPLDIIEFPENKGVSAVFNTAFRHVLDTARDNDIVVTIDSDNTMNPFLTLDMLDALKSSDVVVASRFIPGGQMIGAGYRTVLSYGASWLMRWRVGIPNLSDYSIFYRAMRVSTLRVVCEKHGGEPVFGQGFAAMANFLIHTWQANPGLRFAEVPLVLRYDLKESGSSIRILRTMRGYLEMAFGKKKN